MIHASLTAQEYVPMLDDRNEWHLISCYLGDCFRDVYYTDGDTIVNGQPHKILDGYHYISRTFLLHENTEEKKVFLTTTIDGQVDQKLMYDFNLAEGDTINLFNPITPFPADGGYFHLDSIRMKTIEQGQLAKHFYLSPTISNTQSQGYYPIWVEGLGSLSMVTAPGGNPDYDGAGKISCFFKNEVLFYFDDEMTDQCNSILSTQSVGENSSEIKFTVHQSKGILKGSQPINKIEMFDLSGRKILTQSVSNQNQLEFDLNGFNKGIYFLWVYDGHKIHKISFLLK